jgi:hypothetical protein
MADRGNPFGVLRPWVAPALGLGLVAAGIAVGLGLRNVWAPFVTVAVAAIVLLFGQWRVSQHPTAPDDEAPSPSE